MKKKSFVWVIGFVFLLFVFKSSLFSTVYGSISGKVIDEETGKGIKGVAVSLFTPGADASTVTYTNENGEFVFPEVIPGKCKIGFYPPSPYACAPLPNDHEPIYLERGKNLYIVKKLKYGGIIEGKVYDVSTGSPLEGVEVNIVPSPFRRVETDSQGKFKQDRLYPGKYEIDASLSGFGMKILKGVEVKSKETIFVEIQYDSKDPTRVRGSVKCIGTGEPLRNILVGVGRKDDYGWTDTYTDEKGEYLVVGLEPGIYEICVIGTKKTDKEYGEEDYIEFCKTLTVNKNCSSVVDLYVDCSLEFDKKEGK